MARIAAVDYGLKRIGLSVSDETRRIALPLKLVLAGKNLRLTARAVLDALKGYVLDKIVVGLPLLLSGKRGEMAEAVERFVEALRQETTIEIECMDERLSTSQAERALKEMDYSRKERSQIVDSTAATLLLQAYLEQKR